MNDERMTFEETGAKLARLIDESVAKAVSGHSKVAVAFSGGLDSSVVARCARDKTKVLACTAFVRGSRDSRSAEQGAAALGIELMTTELTKDLVDSELNEMTLGFQPTLMDRSLWCIYYAVARTASRAGAEKILLGQLSDELFGGYAKYESALASHGKGQAADCMDMDIEEYMTRGIARDTNACSAWLEPGFPFTEKAVVEFGRSIPVSYKIRDGVRKAVLREAASILGVPEELASAAKKAAQYSSGIQKIVRSSRF